MEKLFLTDFRPSFWLQLFSGAAKGEKNKKKRLQFVIPYQYLFFGASSWVPNKIRVEVFLCAHKTSLLLAKKEEIFLREVFRQEKKRRSGLTTTRAN